MGDERLKGLGGQGAFLEALSVQIAKDMGMLLGRRGDVKRKEWALGNATDRWMAATFELCDAAGSRLGTVELGMARKPAVVLAADLVRAPNFQSMVAGGPLSEMVADGMREAANVCGAALARVFKQPLGGTGTCHLLTAAWDAEVGPTPTAAWRCCFELAFTGMKEPLAFDLALLA